MLFTLSIITLLLGPILYSFAYRKKQFSDAIDGFIFVVIGGLVCFDLIPNYFSHGGWVSLLLLVLGLLLPTLVEHIVHHSDRYVHKASLALGASALIFHAILDGTALDNASANQSQFHLAISVILHRFPIGLTIWWLLRPKFSIVSVSAVFISMIISTFIGLQLGDEIITTLESEQFIWLQSFITGTVIHVILHPTNKEANSHHHHHKTYNFWEGGGNVAGFALLYTIFSIMQEHDHHHRAFDTFYALLLEIAPALLLAFTFGGLLMPFLPMSSINWLNKGSNFNRSARGMLLGLPLPVCSCGVTPLYKSLINKGASPAAAIAFLIATPELGIDAIIVSIPLLGGEVTVVRVLCAVILAVFVGLLIGKFARSVHLNTSPKQHQALSTKQKFSQGLREGYVNLFDHTGPWILLGLVIASFAAPLLEHNNLSHLPYGLDVILFALLGIPVYVCASGATPIIAVFLAAGGSLGAALAFLLTGPATNASTFGIVKSVHGSRTALLFALVTFTLATAMGLIVNQFASLINVVSMTELHQHDLPWLNQFCLLLIGALFLASLMRNGFRGIVNEVIPLSKLQLSHHH